LLRNEESRHKRRNLEKIQTLKKRKKSNKKLKKKRLLK
jgi:hypothetical protein